MTDKEIHAAFETALRDVLDGLEKLSEDDRLIFDRWPLDAVAELAKLVASVGRFRLQPVWIEHKEDWGDYRRFYFQDDTGELFVAFGVGRDRDKKSESRDAELPNVIALLKKLHEMAIANTLPLRKEVEVDQNWLATSNGQEIMALADDDPALALIEAINLCGNAAIWCRSMIRVENTCAEGKGESPNDWRVVDLHPTYFWEALDGLILIDHLCRKVVRIAPRDVKAWAIDIAARISRWSNELVETVIYLGDCDFETRKNVTANIDDAGVIGDGEPDDGTLPPHMAAFQEQQIEFCHQVDIALGKSPFGGEGTRPIIPKPQVVGNSGCEIDPNAPLGEGDWLLPPLSLKKMGERLGDISTYKVRVQLKSGDLRPYLNRQTFTVRLDKLPPQIVAQLKSSSKVHKSQK